MVSVIVQVWVFKATKEPDGQGRRIFRMAPLHATSSWRHQQRTVVPCFWLMTAALVLLGLLLRPIG